MKVLTFVRQTGGTLFGFEITWESNYVELAEGPAGTDGDVSSRTFASGEEADEFVEQLVAKLLKDGWSEHEGGLVETPARISSNPEFEAALTESPDDVEAYLVYADWLQSQGDPRGELINLWHQLKQDTGRADLVEAIAHLHRAHAKLLTRDLLRFPDSVSLEWFMGFIRSATFGGGQNPYADGVSSDSLVTDLVDSATSGLLQKFAMVRGSTRGASGFESALELIAKPAVFPILDHLEFGNPEQSPYGGYNNLLNGELIWGAFPRLRTLKLWLQNFAFGEVVAPVLEELHLGGKEGVYPTSTLEGLGFRAPRLHTLHLSAMGSFLNHDHLDALASGEGLPSLKHLKIVKISGSNDALARLCAGRLLGQLETLDLSKGTLRTQELLAHAPKLRHLKSLNIPLNLLDDLETIKEKLPFAEVGHQRTPPDREYDEEEDAYESEYYDDTME